MIGLNLAFWRSQHQRWDPRFEKAKTDQKCNREELKTKVQHSGAFFLDFSKSLSYFFCAVVLQSGSYMHQPFQGFLYRSIKDMRGPNGKKNHRFYRVCINYVFV